MKSASRCFYVPVSCLLASLSPTVHADVLASYAFTDASVVSSDAHVNSTASSFGAGAGIDDGDGYTLGWAQVNSNFTSAITTSVQTPAERKTTAIEAGDYFSFTITPSAGQVLSLSSLEFEASYYDATATSSRRGFFFVRSSADNFANDLHSTDWVLDITQQAGAVFVSGSVDLTSISSTALAGPVEFRIYLTASSTGSTRRMAIDNVILNGTTSAIPEPSSYGLLAGGAFLVGALFRRGGRPSRSVRGPLARS